MALTGRHFIYDSDKCELVKDVPQHDDWALWTEHSNEHGLWYVSDHEGYTLDEDEFGDAPSDMVVEVCDDCGMPLINGICMEVAP